MHLLITYLYEICPWHVTPQFCFKELCTYELDQSQCLWDLGG